MPEKITEQIKLHLPESMLRDVQDAAMADDRKVSEFIRHVVALYLYGLKGMPSACGFKGANRGGDEGCSND
jgi:hypothetical protein